MPNDAPDASESQSDRFAPLLPPLRLGVIGCELARVRYGAALSRLASIQVVGLTDAEDRFARVWARELGGKIPVYINVVDLLSTSLDAVLVAVPLAERAQRITEALNAGMSVLAEIPFAPTLPAVDALLALAQERNLLLMPALPRRLDPYFLELARETASGSIGELRQTRCAWSFPLENVPVDSDIVNAGWNAALQTLACQTIDLCRWWQGEAVTVSADIDLERLASARQNGGGRIVEGTLATIIVSHVSGQSTHQITRTRAIQPDERYIVTGTAGSLELVVSAGSTASPSARPNLQRQQPGKRWSNVAVNPVSADITLSPSVLRMRNLLTEFAACVQTDAAPAFTGMDARAALEIVHAAYVSTNEKAKVALPLRRNPDIGGLLNAFPSTPRILPS